MQIEESTDGRMHVQAILWQLVCINLVIWQRVLFNELSIEDIYS